MLPGERGLGGGEFKLHSRRGNIIQVPKVLHYSSDDNLAWY